jgi:transposase
MPWRELLRCSAVLGTLYRLDEPRHMIVDAAIRALRAQVERTFAWEDTFKRLLLRFERIQQRHYGMKLMADTLINLRAFCGA